jgi:hypothetical protein
VAALLPPEALLHGGLLHLLNVDAYSGNIQGTIRERSGIIQGTLNEH